MIQRIQSIYLAITIILLSVVTFGSPLFMYLTATKAYKFTSFGLIQFDAKTGQTLEVETYPIYIATSVLILLYVFCLLSYKKIKKQSKFLNLTFTLNLLLAIALVLFSLKDDLWLFDEKVVASYGIGFYLFLSTLPITFMAILGVKKDKSLLDSLNRLR